MGLWVERDKRTGDVILCSQDEKTSEARGASSRPGGGGRDVSKVAPVRRIRLKPDAAKVLALRILAASDEDAESLVEGTQEAVKLVSNGAKVAKDAHAFLKGVQAMFRED